MRVWFKQKTITSRGPQVLACVSCISHHFRAVSGFVSRFECRALRSKSICRNVANRVGSSRFQKAGRPLLHVPSGMLYEVLSHPSTCHHYPPNFPRAGNCQAHEPTVSQQDQQGLVFLGRRGEQPQMENQWMEKVYRSGFNKSNHKIWG